MYIYSPYKGLLSNKVQQRVYYIIRVANLDKYGNVKWQKESELTFLDFNRNEEKFIMSLDNVQMPLVMNLHVACHPANSRMLMESTLA